MTYQIALEAVKRHLGPAYAGVIDDHVLSCSRPLATQTLQITGNFNQFKDDSEFVAWLTAEDENWSHCYSDDNYRRWRAWLAGKGVQVIEAK
jgi:hypothetical protein